MARKTIIEQQELEFIDSGEGYFMWEGELSTTLEGNTTYYVVWDGVEYGCTTSNSDDRIILGNYSILNLGDDTYEPFLIGIGGLENDAIVTNNTKDLKHTLAIYRDVAENIVIKNPLGKSVTYGEYNNLTVSNSNGTKTTFSKLPKVSMEDNGKILGVVNGVWSKIDDGSGQTGTIEKDVVIEWNTHTIPTVTFDMSALGYTAHKISDNTPTKEQLLSAKWRLSNPIDDEIYNSVLTENNILLENNDIIVFQLYAAANLGYVVCYNSGVITVSYSGVDISINIPEIGIYQLWDFGYNLPNTMFGSMAYTEIEEVDFIQSDWNQTDYTKPDYIKHKPKKELPESTSEDAGKVMVLDENGLPMWAKYESNVQPNWNQNDNTKPDYIQNKPFYSGITPEELIPKDSFVLTRAGGSGELYFYRSMTDITEEVLNKWYSNWISVDIEWNNVVYNCTAKDYFGNKTVGNLATTIFSTEDTGEPFCVYMVENEGNFLLHIWARETFNQESVTHSMKLSINTEDIHKIDAKYLPDEICVPTITVDTDEGKFLRVVGGVATWTTVPNAEEASF